MPKINYMPSISADTLFHYTKSLSVLKKILTNGIRFSYSVEHPFPNLNIAIPMVSFCDIPLSKAYRHAKKYGNFCIGLNKDFITYLYNPIINPLIYIDSNNLNVVFSQFLKAQAANRDKFLLNISTIAKQLENSLTDEQKLIATENIDSFARSLIDEKEFELATNCQFSENFILGLLKPTYSDTGYCYYDEREWRAFWLDDKENSPWIWDTENLNKDKLEKFHNTIAKSKNGFLSVEENYFNMVNYIIVAKDKQILPLIHFIMKSPKLLGYTNLSTDQRLFLVSRITSFERISGDI